MQVRRDLNGQKSFLRKKTQCCAIKIKPIEVLSPSSQLSPVVFASPHSGKHYPEDFLKTTNLSPHQLRLSEDAFVDQLFDTANEYGAPLLKAHFPRAFVDPNREAFELDPQMFNTILPKYVKSESPRVRSGLGTIARIVANGIEIYNEQLCFKEVKKRIEQNYYPYHTQLAALIEATRLKFGACLLVDCHSMPSLGGAGDTNSRRNRMDIVLGDLHGTSCSPIITDLAYSTLKDLGYSVTFNKPYAGGYTTKQYGRPNDGVHSLQIEINRALYMDEVKIAPLPSFSKLKTDIAKLVAALTSINPDQLTS